VELAGTSAIVTGGASGLGAATAASLAGAGARVHSFDLSSSIAYAPEVDGVQHHEVDVTDPEQVRAAIAAVPGPLRTVVSCAGIAPSARILGRTGVHDLGLYAKTIAINLVGTFNVLALASEAIASTTPDAHGQRGLIINTASIAAYEGQVGQAAYASSKGGIVGLTLPAARDLAQHGIRVMTIAPGTMLTPMMLDFAQDVLDGLAAGVPFPHRLGGPEEYAKLVLSIVANDYLNGEVIRLDGALRMPPR
jgi:NAD(P)-dependent dehydrogenase (short-subunit alcohol dehydrogenase family)